MYKIHVFVRNYLFKLEYVLEKLEKVLPSYGNLFFVINRKCSAGCLKWYLANKNICESQDELLSLSSNI